MKKYLKHQIKQTFQAPQPVGKRDFFLTLASDTVARGSLFAYLQVQAGYIRKRIWAASLVLLTAVLCQLKLINAPFQAVAVCSALLPLLSLLVISEVNRSRFYGMAELEMSCKHSFTQIVLARMAILGTLQLLCFLALLTLLAGQTHFTLPQLGLYLLTPMLAATFFTMAIINRLHTRETILICTAVCAALSILQIMIYAEYPLLLSDRLLLLWLAASAVLLAGLIWEVKKLMKETEDLSWNSSLTV